MTKEITPEEVEKGEKLSIIDVREDHEVATGKIPGAKHISLGQLPAHLEEIDQDIDHILVCQSGGRSKAACGLLESNGLKAINMVGGMNDWNGKTEKNAL